MEIQKYNQQAVEKPKSKAVEILLNSPTRYWESTNPKTMAEVFDKQDSPTMIAICNEAGEAWARALMVKLVSNFAEFYSTNNTMSDYQIADTVDLMLEEYPHYKLDDYKLFFKMAKKGYFGQIFGRIDGEVVLSWLKKYDEQRCIEAQNIAIKEKEKMEYNQSDLNIGMTYDEYLVWKEQKLK